MSERDEYFAAARSWADGQSSASARETRIAWRVAAGAAAVALLLAIALALLVPLKTVQPYVVTVDNRTGTVEPAFTVDSGRLTQNEAVIQAQLAGYVIARESFDSTDLSEQYRRVQLMSARPVAAAYVAEMSANNPESPLRTLSAGDTVAIKVRSVSLINDTAALVRYTATRSAAGGGAGQPANFVSAISFGFNGRALNQSDRYDNPLGFQVTRYRRDAEGIVS
ncbi:type IV secretion system protein [Sphingomonas sabuli]|uniref:Type IV secretion system protein n=1 Tax=Sphingomonas sabuli TaxID=2764186 RepID=A0A7G9KZC3_9SPHN|nr:type IV secretion system protein [Sphingomonas sabuli]QNM81722.1 type IV secretion system protein [Sphingomonas sabuli]